MAEFARPPAGPDLSQGVPVTTVHASGVVPGHVGGDPVRLSLIGGGMFAVSATCTHCGAPLGAGLIVDDEVRCPWHRACFSLRSGHALKAPAFAALATWRVERVGDDVFVRNDNEPGASAPALRPNGAGPQRIVSIGGGAAAFAAADRLRALGYQGSLSMLSADASAPYDRPNLSKNFLAGTVPEDCLALRPRGCYVEPGIEPHLWCGVTAIDVTAREVTPRAGARFASDVLLVATGAEPVRLPTPGFDRRNVFLLPTLEDARAVIAAASGAASAVLIVGGLIGLEAAGALRTRGLAVHVVMRDAVPMVRPGRGIRPVPAGRAPAARRGVPCAGRYHRARWRVRAPGRRNAHPRGPRHRLYRRQATRHASRAALAEAAGLAMHDGSVVDGSPQSSVQGTFAAGDVARFPLREEPARVEHSVHAQRQGQIAASNMLGDRRRKRTSTDRLRQPGQPNWSVNTARPSNAGSRASSTSRLWACP